MAAVILRLDNVSKSFGALKVSDSVTFAVPRGEALGVIGPNGAGKSTLFNLITGNLLPHAGRIELLGRDVTRAPAMERVRMGSRPQFSDPAAVRGTDRIREPPDRRRFRPGRTRG